MAKTALAASEELVVLVDEHGKETGTAAKASVHHEATPLHLAFSCYLFDGDGRVLLTRRARQKPTWPGVWTNSFCGHPAPGERTVDAVHRRGRQELGLTIDEAVCVLPDFRYRAVAADGTVENEICPVFCAHADDSVRPAPDEVMDYRWVPWRDVRQAAGLPWVISPWAVEQIPLLDASTYMDHGPSSSGSSGTQMH